MSISRASLNIYSTKNANKDSSKRVTEITSELLDLELLKNKGEETIVLDNGETWKIDDRINYLKIIKMEKEFKEMK